MKVENIIKIEYKDNNMMREPNVFLNALAEKKDIKIDHQGHGTAKIDGKPYDYTIIKVYVS